MENWHRNLIFLLLLCGVAAGGTNSGICPFGAIATAEIEKSIPKPTIEGEELLTSPVFYWVLSHPEDVLLDKTNTERTPPEKVWEDLAPYATAGWGTHGSQVSVPLIWEFLKDNFKAEYLTMETLPTKESQRVSKILRSAGINNHDYAETALLIEKLSGSKKQREALLALMAKGFDSAIIDGPKIHTTLKMLGPRYNTQKDRFNELDTSFSENQKKPLGLATDHMQREIYEFSTVVHAQSIRMRESELWRPIIERTRAATKWRMKTPPKEEMDEVLTGLHDALQRRIIAMRFLLKDWLLLQQDRILLQTMGAGFEARTSFILGDKCQRLRK